MKKILLMNIMFLMLAAVALAQDRVVTGKVTSVEDGGALPGVSVVVKGTTTGTVTDSDGNFLITVPGPTTVLTFSFIGTVSQDVTVGERTVVDVALVQDSKQLDEVVVTAIGVERSSKSLGYSVATVNSDEINQGRTPSVLSSLQGKMAGVMVSGSSGAPGASSKVIVRGFTSLSGGNNPLYVVDGIPIESGFTGTTTLNGASDFGSRVNDINPEDIESLTVLKGAAATTLYGSRAAAGVVIITTKKGKDAAMMGKKAQVTVASSLMMDEILKLPTFQNQFGQGFFGSSRDFPNENTSWGSAFDGKDRVWGRVVDNQQRVKPFVGLKNNVKEFFDIGKTFTNSVSLQGGNKSSNYYISYANVDADGIMPTDADSYKRNTLSVRGATELATGLTSSASINYARTNSSFVPTGQGPTVYNQILQTPRDISLLELSDINNKFNDPEGYYSEFTVNPWYVLKKFGSTGVIDRFYGNAEIGYKATEWLSFTGRVGSDVTNSELKKWIPKTEITGPNSPKADPGYFSYQKISQRQFNTDILANINKNLSTFINFSGLVGLNINERMASSLFSEINDLVIPGFYNLSNTANTPTSNTNFDKRRLIGVYAQANFSYRDFLYLSVSGRNDWSSTLPENSRSFFYPGVNMGLDITSALGMESSTLSYAKLRASWAQVGKDAGTYQIRSIFIQGGHTDGYSNYNAPYAQHIPGFEVSNQIGNPNLEPEISTDIELGLDLRFLGNRIGLDATLYQRDVKNNILAAPITASSGYTSQILNIAKLRNRGIELLLTATPVQTRNLKWDISVNWAKNVSEVLDLGGPSQLAVGGLSGNSLIARVGHPAFEIEGSVPLRDANGRIVVSANGQPIANPNKQVLGNTQYKFTAGITNRITYKGISLAGTFDIRNGGIMYSRTSTLVYFSGTTPATTFNDRNPFIVPNSAQQVLDGAGEPVIDDNGFPVTVDNTTPISITDGEITDYWGSGGSKLDRSFMVSKSFVKLRELVLSYSLPKAMLDRTPFGKVEVSLIGRNLFLWVPKENVFIDPEQTTFGTDIGSEFGEYGSTPTTRSYGFNIRLTL